MRVVYMVVFALIVLAIAIFALQNLQMVTVAFLGFAIQAPVALIAIAIYVLGMLTGSSLWAALRRTWGRARQHP